VVFGEGGTSKNEIAAASLMTLLEERWKEGGSSSLGTIGSGYKKIKRPEGVSDEFMRAVEETVAVVQRYFTPSGGSSWPSVAEVVCECFTAADQVYGEDRAKKFAENHRWTEEQLSYIRMYVLTVSNTQTRTVGP
jgi:benzoyl-CoA reductase/2-hydroxyglutaryl-CoA dehydratase subunit BcrC/BadD/HgdB